MYRGGDGGTGGVRGSDNGSVSSDGGGSGLEVKIKKVGTPGGDARVQVRYDTYLPTLYLWDGKKLRTLLAGAVIPTIHDHVLCKNWHLCGVCWEDCDCKNLHVPNPQRRQPQFPASKNSLGGLT